MSAHENRTAIKLLCQVEDSAGRLLCSALEEKLRASKNFQLLGHDEKVLALIEAKQQPVTILVIGSWIPPTEEGSMSMVGEFFMFYTPGDHPDSLQMNTNLVTFSPSTENVDLLARHVLAYLSNPTQSDAQAQVEEVCSRIGKLLSDAEGLRDHGTSLKRAITLLVRGIGKDDYPNDEMRAKAMKLGGVFLGLVYSAKPGASEESLQADWHSKCRQALGGPEQGQPTAK